MVCNSCDDWSQRPAHLLSCVLGRYIQAALLGACFCMVPSLMFNGSHGQVAWLLSCLAGFLLHSFGSASLQAGLLAQQDSFVPFIWVAVQSVLNVVGDLILIMHFQLGLKGAAWATLLSQLVGTFGLLFMFKSRGQVRSVLPDTFLVVGSHSRVAATVANDAMQLAIHVISMVN